MTPQTTRTTVDFHVRIPPDLHAWVTAEAARLGVSQNAVVAIVLSEKREQRESHANRDPLLLPSGEEA